MEIKVVDYTSFKHSTGYELPYILGSQTIFSEDLQTHLIKIFMDENNTKRFFFSIGNLVLNPLYTSEYCPMDCIIVSDEMYHNHFNNHSLGFVKLDFYYDVPKVKSIRLKRVYGDFPNDDSLETMLTYYLEQCNVVNLGQLFELEHNYGTIKFEITQIVYCDEIKKNIEDRLDEINLTLDFNSSILDESVALEECKSQVHNFKWFYSTIGSSKNMIGDVTNQEVSIDFEVQALPMPPKPPKKKEIPKTSEVKPEPEVENTPQLTKEELRLKRLQYFSTKPK